MKLQSRKLMRGLVVIAATAALALSGCVAGGDDTDSGEHVVRVALSSFGNDTLDPAMDGNTNTLQQVVQMYDTLLDVAEDGSIGAGVAKEWGVSEDGLVWTFELRDDVVFHNGDKLTSADVVFSLDRMQNPLAESGGGTVLTEVIASVEAPDDYTVVITLKAPYAGFPYLLAPYQTETGIIFDSKYMLEEAGDDFAAQTALLEEAPIGSGPFKFVERTKGDVIVYEAVDEHWRNTPGIDRLEIYLVPEAATQLAMLQAGEIDVISIAGDQVEEVESAGAEVRRIPNSLGVGIAFSGTFRPAAADKSSNDVRVREAVSLAINRQEILDTLVGGEGSLPQTPYNTSPATHDVFVEDYEDWAEANNAYDPDKARELLEEAGYPDGVSDIQLFTYARPGTPTVQVGEIVAAQLAEVGIAAPLVATDYGSYREHFVQAPDDDPYNAGDMSTYSGNIRFEAIGALETFWMNENGVVQLLQDDELDADIRAVSGIVDDEERREEVARLLNQASNEFVILPLFDLTALYAVNPDTVGDWTTYLGFAALGRTYETIQAP